jgi:hypothetical protein
MTQQKNFKNISGETQSYDLFKSILYKGIISFDSISLRRHHHKIFYLGSCPPQSYKGSASPHCGQL